MGFVLRSDGLARIPPRGETLYLPPHYSSTTLSEPVEAPSSPAHNFVGRQPETAVLRATFDLARSGYGGTVLISGPAGIGKTSVLQWLEDEAAHFKVTARWGTCLPGISDPFFPFDQVFRGELQHPSPDRAMKPSTGAEDEGLPAALLPSTAPRGRVPGLPMALATMKSEVVKESPTPRVLGATMMEYLSLLEREAPEKPQLILLDDFHWADPESVQALMFLARNVRRLSALIAVALREDEVVDPSFRGVLADLRRGNLAKDVPLRGLREREAQQLLESVSQAPFDTARLRGALRSLLDRTGGNPYFLLETARQLSGAGRLRKEGGQTVLDLPPPKTEAMIEIGVPSSISDLLRKRLEELPPVERSLLEAAAIMGQEFEVAPFREVLGLSPSEQRTVLDSLVSHKHLLSPRGADGNRFVFDHALLWETVRSSIPPGRRKELSRAIASWWERAHPADVERIATYYFEGGSAEKGIAWTELAIEAALQSHAHDRVARHFERGLRLMESEDRPPEAITRWGLAILDRLRGDDAEGRWLEPLGRRLLEKDPPVPYAWDLMLYQVWGNLRHERMARQLLTKLISAVKDRPEATDELLGKVAVHDAVLSYLEGNREASRASAVLALQKLSGSTFYRGLALYRLGWIAMEESDWEGARRHLEQAFACVKAGGFSALNDALVNLDGAVALFQGDLERAEELFRQAVALGKGLGKGSGLSLSLGNLSFVKLSRGDLSGAERDAREALKVAETFGLPRETGVALQHLGEVFLYRRDPEKALEHIRKALTAFEDHAHSPETVQLRLDLADALGRKGDPEGALKELKDMETLFPLKADELCILLRLRARSSTALGERVQARADIERAISEARVRSLRFAEAQGLLLLAEWERMFGTSSEAIASQTEAERRLKECGVIDPAVHFVTGMNQRPGEPVLPSPAPARADLSLRILHHLLRQGGVAGAYGKDDVAPLALTQKGISEGLGLPRDHFNVALKRLVDKGFVSVSTQVVRGAPRRLRVYLLTRAGAETVRDR